MDRYDTIVVGAGIAGLTTARLLHGQGHRTVVLEARDRIGGRVHTDRADGWLTDLGASWIHGITDSPVASAATAFGMPMREFTVGGYQPDSRPIAYFDPSGTRLSADEARAHVADIRRVDADLGGIIAGSDPRASYRDVTEQALRAQRWDAERTARVREYFEHRSEEQYGAWIEDLAAHGLDDDAIDGDEVVFPEGYDVLAERLSLGVDVRLGQIVREVHWHTDGVTVITDADQWHARSAVVTVPVGVLAEGGLTISPALPEPVSGALSRLTMNAFEKVFLRFPERFWDPDVYALRAQGPAARWWHSWYDLTDLHGQPTLLTFAAGPAGIGIRHLTDAEVGAAAAEPLRRLYPEGYVDPIHVRVTRWWADPFARGSYAYMRVGSTTSDHDDLATPIGGVLHLAGEATWTDDPATVTAALCSGHRAAERVLGHTVAIEALWA
ncbi:NAD(P)/FAD-dependent oxidoreductase [Microbacterium chocolatum]|uniref:flavin monoamine oxidase family protein n=1 Tax=Microbacterium aurantiacum TaxID=162393 RepID=UPI00338EC1AD